jgi:hypothetical protein
VVKIRAVVLFSGSLASSIAAKLVEQASSLDLSFVFFRSPFFRGEETVQEEAKKLSFSLRLHHSKAGFPAVASGKRFPFSLWDMPEDPFSPGGSALPRPKV